MTAVTSYAKEAAQLRQRRSCPTSERRQLHGAEERADDGGTGGSEGGGGADAARRRRWRATYGRGKYCPDGESGEACLDIEEITEILAKDRNPARLREVWEGWHTIAPPMKKSYARFVELSNKGARSWASPTPARCGGRSTTCHRTRSSKELDRLWDQLRPLYLSLHTYVRAKLRERYGDLVPADGPIPAHLLGNIWAQDWSNVYDIVGPRRRQRASVADRRSCARRKVTPVEMARYGERFFTSLGFEPLPQTFWERSLFVKPRDREVVCHASAWNINNVDDLRFKMCIDQTDEDFTVIHHELGHNFYSREYTQAADDLPRQRQRRLPRGDRRHDRAVGDAGVPGQGRAARPRARRVGRHRAAAAHGARAAGVPAVRPGRRPVAVAGVQRPGHARQLQPRVVGAARAVPGRQARVAARRGVLRSGRQVSHPGQHSVRAIFPRGRAAVPVSSRARRRQPAARRRCTAARSTATPRPASG